MGGGEEVFEIFSRPLTAEESDALRFLYAYAPLADLTVDPEIYLGSVRATLDARKTMPWADSIPEEIFLHFVLPLRVHNESIDSSRTAFYRELKERVKGLSLRDAALEVNHWCHEKAIYNPSDARTSSPLATVKSAYGRCGEESVFTVAAMRAAGIPARQVYTPRWAHCDDNHAWVEVWDGDGWHYLGACEPEPRLDMGWFTAPSKRGVLMHAKVYGDYSGDEEIMRKTPLFTEINVTSNYAPTKRAEVTVLNADGSPAEGADVEFKVFNYGEFATIAAKTADSEGRVSVELGLGDVLVWASKDGEFGYDRLSVGEVDNLIVTMNRRGDTTAVDFDMTPPAENNEAVSVSDVERALNTERLIVEDSIRNAYTATFYTDAQTADLAEHIGLGPERIARFMKESRGNHDQIEDFLTYTPKELLPMGLELLGVISQKDLRDIEADVLNSHLEEAAPYAQSTDNELFRLYLLNPRVDNEALEAYRPVIKEMFDDTPSVADLIAKAREVRIYDELNTDVASVTPASVARMMAADSRSRDIFFVAMARTFGIPSRLDPFSGKVQYHNGQEWVDVAFSSDGPEAVTPKGSLKLTYSPTKIVPDPKYGSHFTIARIGDDGKLHQVSVRGSQAYDMGPGASLSEAFARPFALDEGRYMITTGTRLANGAVLGRTDFFDIERGGQTDVELILRENKDAIAVIGNIDSEARVLDTEDDKVKCILDITGRGYFMIALIEPRKEPTNHAMRDMAELREALAGWGRPIVFVVKNTAEWAQFDPDEFKGLPEAHYVIDVNGAVSASMAQAGLNADNRPLLVIGDTFNRLVFKSEGYQINLGDNILNVIHKL
ncbi:MAG: transglutaminase-like domain-containing protein [Rikenellaceae bacterium]|nr:transglutaminase-like domain-containing protein [Rikenellaceae bacterium]